MEPRDDLKPIPIWAPPREARSTVAFFLSVVPGLGHIYKRHLSLGFALMVFGAPVSIWVGCLMVLGTFGLSVIAVPGLYWASVAISAATIDDWHDGRRPTNGRP